MSTAQPSRIGPGVVVVGLPDGAERSGVIERWAARGYAATAIDIDASANVDAALAQLRAAMDRQRALSGARGKVAVAAYGTVGVLGFLAVTRLAADAAAIVRGPGIVPYLKAEAPRARVPLSMHFADTDAAVPLADVRAIKGALEGVGVIEIYRYESWDDAALARAERRICEVFDSLGVTVG